MGSVTGLAWCMRTRYNADVHDVASVRLVWPEQMPAFWAERLYDHPDCFNCCFVVFERKNALVIFRSFVNYRLNTMEHPAVHAIPKIPLEVYHSKLHTPRRLSCWQNHSKACVMYPSILKGQETIVLICVALEICVFFASLIYAAWSSPLSSPRKLRQAVLRGGFVYFLLIFCQNVASVILVEYGVKVRFLC